MSIRGFGCLIGLLFLSVCAQGQDRYVFSSAAGTFSLYSDEGATVVTSNGVARFSELRPAREGHPVLRMLVPMSWNDGGTWQVDGAHGKLPFSLEKEPRLYSGPGQRVTFSDPRGRSVGLVLPKGTHVLFQDSRAWEWATYELQVHLPEGATTCEVSMFSDDRVKRREPVLDMFGQVRRDFPDKIKTEAELTADRERETVWYAALAFTNRLAQTGRRLNAFGGVAGSGERMGLKRTGYFHVEEKNGQWHLVDPAGDDFFHLGICSFSPCDDYTYTEGREEDFAWIPPLTGPFAASRLGKADDWWHSRAFSHYLANLIRKFGTCEKTETAVRNIDRMRAAGFNSMGGFCPAIEAAHKRAFPYVDFVPLAGAKTIPALGGILDPFDEASVAAVKRNFAQIAKNADDPLIIGYFLGNEEPFEDIARAVPAKDGTVAAKRALVAFLRRRHATVAALNAAWKTSLGSFEEAEGKSLTVETPEAFADAQAFAEEFVEAYYGLIEREFRAVDSHHMLIGSRWQMRTANNEAICRVAGRHLDVISLNYYTWGIDKALVSRIYAWTGRKPQIWSEFFFSAAAEANPGSFSRDLATQRERGLAYRNYVEGAAALGFVVGTQWFSLIDQSATGRFFQKLNGESFNNGILSVTDRPYRDLLTAMCEAHLAVYPVRDGERAPYRFKDARFTGQGEVKRLYAAGHAVGQGRADGRQDEYPLRPAELISADRLVAGGNVSTVEADYKVAWDEHNLYIHVNVTDKTPFCNQYRGHGIWQGDVVEVFVGQDEVDEDGPLRFTDRQFLFAAKPGGDTWSMRAGVQPKLPFAVERTAAGYQLEAAIPWTCIGRTPKAGDVLRFDVGIGEGADDGKRNTHLVWNGTEENAGDRTHWGRLMLQP